MSILSEILGSIGLFCMQIISSIGYFGIFLLMTMESMILPVPSELVMPFAGFLISSGEMNFWAIVIFSTFGSLVGSLISYYIGRYGGNRFIIKNKEFLFLNKEHLMQTEKWFSKKGELTIFVGRFIPIIRHIISIPAGIGKMDIKKFMLYTVIGAAIWNAFLTYIGWVLGNNWETISKYSDYVSFGILGLLVIGVGYFVGKQIKKRKKSNPKL